MTTVAQILKTKPERSVHTIGPDASVLEALRAMAEKNVGALVVVDGAGRVVGIVSERDYARKMILLDRASRDTPVRSIMSSPVMYVRPQRTADECMALMTENRLRHLPVLDDGEQLVGLVSIGDLVKDIISEQQFIIEQLEMYVTGARG
jgi:CBS domain-containing protein